MFWVRSPLGEVDQWMQMRGDDASNKRRNVSVYNNGAVGYEDIRTESAGL